MSSATSFSPSKSYSLSPPSSSSSSPVQLPFLPGYHVSGSKKPRYPRGHTLEVINGVRVDNARDQALAAHSVNAARNSNNLSLSITSHVESKENFNYNPNYETKEQEQLFMGNTQQSSSLSSSSTLSRLPHFVEYDRKVLRFYGYFKENVHSSPAETWRVRKCVLYCYLEDESIHIEEPKTENSGLPQGVFIKRHRIPRTNFSISASPSVSSQSSKGFFGVDDLSIGAELSIYGRVFRLVDCDSFTREFYLTNGVKLGDVEQYPLDQFTTKQSTAKSATFNKSMHQYKLFMEASLGKHIHPGIQQTQKFLTNDGKVLRFYCQWDDNKMFGEIRPYILHYYLADDTCEVLEIQQPNSGRDPFPVMMKRQKLPVNWSEAAPDCAKIGSLREELHSTYVKERDLKVGNYINVYGRQLFICGTDEFTKRYYISQYNMKDEDFPRLNMEDTPETPKRIDPPPHNGFGSEEDSLGSFLHLIPKVPKPDFKKMLELDGLSLRFMAKFTSPSKVDKERRFVVTYYLSNDQISIYEKSERNSGFIGGKFLEKQRLKNPLTDDYFHQENFFVGSEITLNGYKFTLMEGDEFTRKFMMDYEQEMNNQQGQGQHEK